MASEAERTHWVGCGWEGGPAHYKCLLREIEALLAAARLLLDLDDQHGFAVEPEVEDAMETLRSAIRALKERA